MAEPLYINIHVFDLKSDEREDTKFLMLRKVTASATSAEKQRQKEALKKKYRWMVDIIIWAVTNGKSVEFVNALSDDMISGVIEYDGKTLSRAKVS